MLSLRNYEVKKYFNIISLLEAQLPNTCPRDSAYACLIPLFQIVWKRPNANIQKDLIL